ncbi:right-handed parallel beta-helix repeat-containing protein [Candidatus Bipolaricaulota bacterium]
MKRFMVLVVILTMTGLCALAQTDDPAITYDLAAEVLAEMLSVLDQALRLATTAIIGTPSEGMPRSEIQKHAQAIVNLLEGPESEFYDEDNDLTLSIQEGVRPLLDRLRTRHGDAPMTELFPDFSRGFMNRAIDFQLAWNLVDGVLRKASDVARSMLRVPYSFPLEQEMMSLYSLLVAARGSTSDDFPIGGVSMMVALFPSREIWVEVDESIQDAVDRVPEGGTVFIPPGTFRGTVSISKSVNLVAASHAPNGLLEMGRTVLEGMQWRASIEIESGEPIDVGIRGLVIRNAGGGVSVRGSCAVDLFDVLVEDAGTGIYVDEGAAVEAEECRFNRNERAVSVNGGALCTLLDCAVENAPPKGYSVGVQCSRLEIIGCTFQYNRNFCISVFGGKETELHMVDCTIINNSRGIEYYYGGCATESSTAPHGEKSFVTITGWGNTIPGAGEENENAIGAYHTEALQELDLSFLTQPEPESE